MSETSPTPRSQIQETLPPAPKVVEMLEPGLRRVLAPNPSAMTYWGTNTYLLGEGAIAVIDPGPDLPSHIDAILDAVPRGGRITHVLVTHAHKDHSPGARRLGAHLGVPVHAFGDSGSGRSTVMQRLAAQGLTGGGEGVDHDFVPDVTLADGESLTSPDWEITALHTPGHMGNHLSFGWRDRLFCGDLVMGWASSLVSPPDGDLRDFMSSCRRLQERHWSAFHPGHGLPITDPASRLSWLIHHRETREAQILTALTDSAATPDGLARRIYTDTPPALLPAAIRNVFAHLIDLHGRSRVTVRPELSPNALFALA